MDENAVNSLMSTVELISTNLDARPESWREQLQAIRNTTMSLEILDKTPEEARKRWQLPLVTVFQRVAFADADNGIIQDVANWCLRQALTLLHLYPEDADVLALIGRNWLMRAQKSLASIHLAERGSSSGSSVSASAQGHDQEGKSARAFAEAEERLHTADYVEARGILLPAIEYFQRAVDTARSQDIVTGTLLSTAAETYMSMGNVTSSRVNDQYFQQAMAYLREAAELAEYTLPAHLEQYLDEYGALYPAA
ncbi:hypothetical protein CC86DRAFT_402285 [Ophiobolus disseminans]|uniref:Uncharacterized protein n=1 Tax=Ophiobolus disseminans TaxID=1469910 RepID=A0A6A7AGJ1_9PLEO|nr:hypothetical protein CC86DRAFT_402285 [Ophiobolus disseminans]